MAIGRDSALGVIIQEGRMAAGPVPHLGLGVQRSDQLVDLGQVLRAHEVTLVDHDHRGELHLKP